MNLFRTLGAVALLALAATGLNSCIQAPDYSDTPSINEQGITSFRKSGTLGLRDSVEIALNFEDGDGDLGLGDGDTTGVYAYKKGANRYFNNFFVKAFYKNRTTNTFVPLPLIPGFGYDGRFLRLTEVDARPGPLKGVLRYAIIFSLIDPATAPGTEIQLQVSIADRALRESNVVIMKTVVL